jgi:hypothetical protein
VRGRFLSLRGLTDKPAIKQVDWLLSDSGINVDDARRQHGSPGRALSRHG